MTSETFAAHLQATLDDLQFSRGERQALTAALRDDPPHDDQLADFRRTAFDAARKALGEAAQPGRVLDWLEGVITMLATPTTASDERCTADACFSPGEACRDRIAGMLRTAVHRVDICVFTITDNVLTEAIVEAHRRGVAIRVISDDTKATDIGSDIVLFESVGIPVRVDRTKHHMHHKFAIFDRRRLVTGSYNWTLGAARDNDEHIVILENPPLIARFEREFERLWKRFA